MRIELRLRNILQEHDLDKHGVVSRIASDLGVHRHTIAGLYHNSAKQLRLELLGAICTWLEAKGVPARDLPSRLLGPPELWEFFIRSSSVRVFLGEYQVRVSESHDRRWLSCNDAELLKTFVHSVTKQGRGQPVDLEFVPCQLLPMATDDTHSIEAEEGHQSSRAIYDELCAEEGMVSILVGSQRINLLVEQMVAQCFGAIPFVPSKENAGPPIYLAYRENDRIYSSCFGGHTVPLGLKGALRPGLYYRGGGGEWLSAPFDSTHDAGVILTSHFPDKDSLRIALFGYSGRATRALGEYFMDMDNAREFWPPQVVKRKYQLGLSIYRMEFEREDLVKCDPIPIEGLEQWIGDSFPSLPQH
ncbi:MAG: helix-turn-helix transcriptional regulator [bacterium]|nr:helix-turn-helix transcriptional regulator [bacterium]